MRRDAWWSVALAALACACSGSDSGKTGSPVETDDDPSMVPADQDDTSNDDSNDEAAPPGDGDGDGDGDDPSEEGVIGYDPGDAGAMGDGGSVVIEIPVRKIMCGSSECQTTDNRVCCESWSKATGFDKEPMCIAEATCTQTYNQYTGDTGRAVLSVCEGAEDCPVGQVCCFYTTGMPVFESLIDFTRVGPGAGRSCMTLADCNSDTLGGDPVGLVACSKDEDCSAAGGTCQPELAASVTTGKNGKPRPNVKVCR
jgi:hypothetical protein